MKLVKIIKIKTLPNLNEVNDLISAVNDPSLLKPENPTLGLILSKVMSSQYTF
jgi:hypothetical protein